MWLYLEFRGIPPQGVSGLIHYGGRLGEASVREHENEAREERNLQNKTNLHRRARSVIYFVILPPWMEKNRLRIGTAVFHYVIKKVQLVRMAKKLYFFSLPTDQLARDQWLHAIRRDTGEHFTITDATKVCSRHFKEKKKNTLRRVWELAD